MRTSKGFRVTGGKGVHFTFANGFTVSIQWGPGNYCDNYDKFIPEHPVSGPYAVGEEGSTTAECAVWGPDGEMIRSDKWLDGTPDLENEYCDTVRGYMSPDEVLALMVWAAKQ